MKRGFSTLELMIAMTILVLVMSAVVIVAFGNQTFAIGSQTDSEAVNKAQELLETQQANARKDFNMVNPVASTTDGIYEKAVYVTMQPDHLTKDVKAVISWTTDHMVKKNLELRSLISNFDTPVGGNTCNSALSGNWQLPSIVNATTDFASLVGDGANTYTLSDVDAYQGKLYVTAGNAPAGKPTLFIFDISNPANPSLLGTSGTTINGLKAVRVSQDPAVLTKTYAYAANGSSVNYATCNPMTNPNCGQLDIFDVTNAAAPTLGANLMLGSTTAPFFAKGTVAGEAGGNSIFFKNGYIILGLTKTSSGQEFNLVDARNTTNLYNAAHLLFPIGAYAVGNDVNSAVMRGTYAYITSPNAQELQTINMTNPTAMTLVGGFNSPSGAGNGKSLALVGNNLYLGITVPNAGTDFHILDNTTPGAALIEQGSGIDLASSANAVLQRDFLSFILTNTDLRIYRTDNPAVISNWATVTLPSSGSATEPSMDCEDNYMYVVSNNGSNRGFLYVITAS